MRNPKANAEHMSDEAFADLKKALEAALAFERGELRDLRVTRIPKTNDATPRNDRDPIKDIKKHF
jgi:hypothetical protein